MQQARAGPAPVGVVGPRHVGSIGRIDLELAQLDAVGFRIVAGKYHELDVPCLQRIELERLRLRVRFERPAHHFLERIGLSAVPGRKNGELFGK